MGEKFEMNGPINNDDSDGEYRLDDIKASDDVITRAGRPLPAKAAPKAEPETESEPEEEESPEVNMEHDDVKAEEGQKLTLKCRVSGKPKPKVKWRRGKQKIKPLPPQHWRLFKLVVFFHQMAPPSSVANSCVRRSRTTLRF